MTVIIGTKFVNWSLITLRDHVAQRCIYNLVQTFSLHFICKIFTLVSDHRGDCGPALMSEWFKVVPLTASGL